MNVANETRPALRVVPSGGTLPAHDLDAERAVVSAFLLDADESSKHLGALRPEHFFDPRHQHIMAAVLAVMEAGQPVDIVTVRAQLDAAERLVDVGGVAYLANVIDTAPAVGNLAAHAELVFQAWRMRQAADLGARIAGYCRGAVPDPDAAINRAVTAFETLRATRFADTQSTASADVVASRFKQLEAIAQGESLPTVVPTGLTQFDMYLGGGWRAKRLSVVAARPGSGKTAVGLASLLSCVNLPVEQGGGGGIFFSLEAPKEEIVDRALAMMTGIASQDIENGRLNAAQWGELTNAAGWLARFPLWFETALPLSVVQMRARMRAIRDELATRGLPLRLVVIDYLSLVEPPATDNRGRNREQEVAEVSKAINALKKEFDCAILLLAQLNRESEGQKARRPTKRDLRESGQVEQDADTIIFLWRPDEKDDPETVEAWFDKNRGRTKFVGTGLHVHSFNSRVSEVAP